MAVGRREKSALRVWDWRTLFWTIGALAVAILCFTHAVASIVSYNNPNLALSVWPGDSRALTRKAELLAFKEDRSSILTAGRLARQSLATDALQVRALRVMATAADLRGETARATSQMLLANRLSRRDLLTQLWAIEFAIGRGNVDGVLRHYDAALRTKPDSQTILFPVLAGGLGEAGVRRSFAPYLRKAPDWMVPFLTYAAERGSNPQALVTLLATDGRGTVGQTGEVPSKLLTRLLSIGAVRDAERYAHTLPAYHVGLEQDISLNSATMAASLRPLTWAGQEQNGLFARPNEGEESFHIFADTGTTGDVLERFLSIRPGRYVFAVNQEIASAGVGASATWRLDCLHNGQFVRVWELREPMVANSSQLRDEMALPNDCAHQHLTLKVNGGGDANTLDFKVTSISIKYRN